MTVLGRCTYCSSSNPVLLAANKDAGDLDIDHVLTHNVDSDITSAQVWVLICAEWCF